MDAILSNEAKTSHGNSNINEKVTVTQLYGSKQRDEVVSTFMT